MTHRAVRLSFSNRIWKTQINNLIAHEMFPCGTETQVIMLKETSADTV